ncbi:MAG TPA: hypothetical protein VGC32_07445 [Solirubrobacterales bacterium]
MNRRERTERVRLDGRDERQRATVLEGATDWLVTLASDLCRYGPGDTVRVTGEIAALGRLAAWLRMGSVAVPDGGVRSVIERRLGETRHLDELEKEYEEELAEHDAWRAVGSYFVAAREVDRDD